MGAIVTRILIWCWNWIASNGTAKVYTSSQPEGRHLGGHDDPRLRDWFIIIDVRAAGKIILYGYFQAR